MTHRSENPKPETDHNHDEFEDNEITELNMDLSSLNDFRNGMEAKN